MRASSYVEQKSTSLMNDPHCFGLTTSNLRKETLLRERYHQEKKENELKSYKLESELLKIKQQSKIVIEKCKIQVDLLQHENNELKKENFILQQNKLKSKDIIENKNGIFIEFPEKYLSQIFNDSSLMKTEKMVNFSDNTQSIPEATTSDRLEILRNYIYQLLLQYPYSEKDHHDHNHHEEHDKTSNLSHMINTPYTPKLTLNELQHSLSNIEKIDNNGINNLEMTFHQRKEEFLISTPISPLMMTGNKPNHSSSKDVISPFTISDDLFNTFQNEEKVVEKKSCSSSSSSSISEASSSQRTMEDFYRPDIQPPITALSTSILIEEDEENNHESKVQHIIHQIEQKTPGKPSKKKEKKSSTVIAALKDRTNDMNYTSKIPRKERNNVPGEKSKIEESTAVSLEYEKKISSLSNELEMLKSKYSESMIQLTQMNNNHSLIIQHYQNEKNDLQCSLQQTKDILNDYSNQIIHYQSSEGSFLQKIKEIEKEKNQFQVNSSVYEEKAALFEQEKKTVLASYDELKEQYDNLLLQQQLGLGTPSEEEEEKKEEEAEKKQALSLVIVEERNTKEKKVLEDELLVMQSKYSQLIISSLNNNMILKDLIKSILLTPAAIALNQASSNDNMSCGTTVEQNTVKQEGESEMKNLKQETTSEVQDESSIEEKKETNINANTNQDDYQLVIINDSTSSAILYEQHQHQQHLLLLQNTISENSSLKDREIIFEKEILFLQNKLKSIKLRFKSYSLKLKEKISFLENEKDLLFKETSSLTSSNQWNERLLMSYEEMISTTTNSCWNGNEREELRRESKVGSHDGEDDDEDGETMTTQENQPDHEEQDQDQERDEEERNRINLSMKEMTEIGTETCDLYSTSLISGMKTEEEQQLLDFQHQQQYDNFKEQISSLQSELSIIQKKMKERSSKAITKMKSLFNEIQLKSTHIDSQQSSINELSSLINLSKLENSSLKKEINSLTKEIHCISTEYEKKIEILNINNEKKSIEIKKLLMILENERNQMKTVKESIFQLGNMKEKLIAFNGSNSNNNSKCTSKENSHSNSRNNSIPSSAYPSPNRPVSSMATTTVEEEEESQLQQQQENGLEKELVEYCKANEEFQQQYHTIQQQLQSTLASINHEKHYLVTNHLKKESSADDQDNYREGGEEEQEVEENRSRNYKNCLKDYNHQINSISLTLFDRIKLLYKENEKKSDEIEEISKKYDEAMLKMNYYQDLLMKNEIDFEEKSTIAFTEEDNI
jgi:hypothetical protein